MTEKLRNELRDEIAIGQARRFLETLATFHDGSSESVETFERTRERQAQDLSKFIAAAMDQQSAEQGKWIDDLQGVNGNWKTITDSLNETIRDQYSMILSVFEKRRLGDSGAKKYSESKDFGLAVLTVCGDASGKIWRDMGEPGFDTGRHRMFLTIKHRIEAEISPSVDELIESLEICASVLQIIADDGDLRTVEFSGVTGARDRAVKALGHQSSKS